MKKLLIVALLCSAGIAFGACCEKKCCKPCAKKCECKKTVTCEPEPKCEKYVKVCAKPCAHKEVVEHTTYTCPEGYSEVKGEPAK